MSKVTVKEYDRIRLAEFVGWWRDSSRTPRAAIDEHLDWVAPTGDRWFPGTSIPDPLHNHADCHALIEALNDARYVVEICKGLLAAGDLVKISTLNPRPEWTWTGPDYRTGVVTLALEILEGKDGNT